MAAERLWDDDLTGAADLVQRLTAAFAPLAALYTDDRRHSLAAFTAAHSATAELLAALPDDDPARQEERY